MLDTSQLKRVKTQLDMQAALSSIKPARAYSAMQLRTDITTAGGHTGIGAQGVSHDSRLGVVVVGVEVNILQVELHQITDGLLHGCRVLVQQPVHCAAGGIGGISRVGEVEEAVV